MKIRLKKVLSDAGWSMVLASTLGMVGPVAGQTGTNASADQRLPGKRGAKIGSASVQEKMENRPAEIRVETAWLGNPATYPYRLEARAVSGALEIRGYVPNEAVREQALSIAREESGLRVLDGLKVYPRLAISQTHKSAEDLHRDALMMLAESMPQLDRNVEVSVWANGKVMVKGGVSTLEEMLAVSRALRRVSGCTCVVNQLEVAEVSQGAPANALDLEKPPPPKQASSVRMNRVPKPPSSFSEPEQSSSPRAILPASVPSPNESYSGREILPANRNMHAPPATDVPPVQPSAGIQAAAPMPIGRPADFPVPPSAKQPRGVEVTQQAAPTSTIVQEPVAVPNAQVARPETSPGEYHATKWRKLPAKSTAEKTNDYRTAPADAGLRPVAAQEPVSQTPGSMTAAQAPKFPYEPLRSPYAQSPVQATKPAPWAKLPYGSESSQTTVRDDMGVNSYSTPRPAAGKAGYSVIKTVPSIQPDEPYVSSGVIIHEEVQPVVQKPRPLPAAGSSADTAHNSESFVTSGTIIKDDEPISHRSTPSATIQSPEPARTSLAQPWRRESQAGSSGTAASLPPSPRPMIPSNEFAIEKKPGVVANTANMKPLDVAPVPPTKTNHKVVIVEKMPPPPVVPGFPVLQASGKQESAKANNSNFAAPLAISSSFVPGAVIPTQAKREGNNAGPMLPTWDKADPVGSKLVIEPPPSLRRPQVENVNLAKQMNEVAASSPKKEVVFPVPDSYVTTGSIILEPAPVTVPVAHPTVNTQILQTSLIGSGTVKLDRPIPLQDAQKMPQAPTTTGTVTSGTIIFDEPDKSSTPQALPAVAKTSSKHSALRDRIAAACGKPASDVDVIDMSATEIQVRVKAKSTQEGEKLSTAIFQMAELEPYQVSLEIPVMK